jgi:hypothetical protein
VIAGLFKGSINGGGNEERETPTTTRYSGQPKPKKNAKAKKK